MKQTELEELSACKRSKRRPSRENECEQVTTGFGFTRNWMRKSGGCARDFNQPQTAAKLKQKQIIWIKI